MARGNGSDNANLKLIFMNLRGLKKSEKPHFTQTEGLGEGKYKELDETVTKVSGTLKKVELKEKVINGENSQEVKLWLSDALAGEMCVVGFNLTTVGRGIINTLLGITPPFGELSLSLYNKKDNGMAAVYIEHNGNKAGWKYAPDELKGYIKENVVSKQGVDTIVRDYFKLDQFLLKELMQKVAPKLSMSVVAPTTFTGGSDNATITLAVAGELDNNSINDDLPF